MIELNKVYNEDCLEGMKRIPDGSVDCIVCDLPYGTTACAWDSVIPLPVLWSEYKRVVKPHGAIVLTCTQPFTSQLVMSNTKMYRHQWIWAKNTVTGFANAKKQPLRCFEDILVFGNQSPLYNPQDIVRVNLPHRNGASVGGATVRGDIEKSRNKGNLRTAGATYTQEYTNYPRQILYFDSDVDTFHPTQKPVALIQYLIRTYSNEGDTILDNCMGSGTTAIAAIREKRNFIGFELNKEYYDKACKRIKLEQAQLTLF